MKRMRHDSSVRAILVCCAVALAMTIFSRPKQLSPPLPVASPIERKQQRYLVAVFIGLVIGLIFLVPVHFLDELPLKVTLLVAEGVVALALIVSVFTGIRPGRRKWPWLVEAPFGAAALQGILLIGVASKADELWANLEWVPLSAGISILAFAISIAFAMDVYLSQQRRHEFENHDDR